MLNVNKEAKIVYNCVRTIFCMQSLAVRWVSPRRRKFRCYVNTPLFAWYISLHSGIVWSVLLTSFSCDKWQKGNLFEDAPFCDHLHCTALRVFVCMVSLPQMITAVLQEHLGMKRPGWVWIARSLHQSASKYSPTLLYLEFQFEKSKENVVRKEWSPVRQTANKYRKFWIQFCLIQNCNLKSRE